eukprot:SAG11_NODE_18386_length_492_cov_1.351145_1_plen_26_part_10
MLSVYVQYAQHLSTVSLDSAHDSALA